MPVAPSAVCPIPATFPFNLALLHCAIVGVSWAPRPLCLPLPFATPFGSPVLGCFCLLLPPPMEINCTFYVHPSQGDESSFAIDIKPFGSHISQTDLQTCLELSLVTTQAGTHGYGWSLRGSELRSLSNKYATQITKSITINR